ncbi:MAG: glycoside hydrolase family protein [Saprospiraceae bacterium]|nr:glycoside hydrolase family protein [Saprospiraceae bacterium]
MPVIGLGLGLGALSERYTWPFFPNYRDVVTMTTGTDEDIETRALARAKAILIAEEGRRNDVYRDTRGFLTVGIGHKVIPADNLVYGQTISNERIDSLFATDIARAFTAAVSQAKEIGRYNVDMVARLTSVNFQLGTAWRTKFPNTWTLIKNGNINQAIQNLINSAWYQQTPTRVANFISTLQSQYA